MKVVFKTDNGRLIQGDNVEAMKKLKDSSIDSCISDFPYNLSFMGKKWDTKNNFYDWCKERAIELQRIIKPGGYVLIFGHPKTNHRMKCAFEDTGFNVVEEINWIYGTGFPKNQDIGKMFDKKIGVEREVVGNMPIGWGGLHQNQCLNDDGWSKIGMKYNNGLPITAPSSEQAKKWNGWKTAGLKPAHEPITVFQKPLEGTYIQNIEKWNCGAINIDVCRILTSQEDKDIINETGRFPANVIFDTYMGEELDNQSGISKSTDGCGEKSKGALGDSVYGKYKNEKLATNAGGLGDVGGASRYFLKIEEEDFVPFLYCPKATKKEKGNGNTHVTVKPKQLIKWLIKLVTPKNGLTIDITAGSGTHGLSCEELNKEEDYNLKWINIELLNTEKEPYCEIAKNRIKDVI